MMSQIVALSLSFCALVPLAQSHGYTTGPRARGALRTQRAVSPRVIDPLAPIDYCPHCQNGGGTGALASYGPWTPYEPMQGNQREGFGICGDPVGVDDHMKTGKFANPPSTPYVEKYTPGGVANFEFDVGTNHNGYIEFYLCDVANNPNQDIQFSTFAQDCHYLERSPHPDCEAGTDKECGPIDPEYPGRWVLPCRPAIPGGVQIVGGPSGKMAYRIPDVGISVGVVHTYWSTRNSCTDEFMENYSYPEAWGTCLGDGGSVGGKPSVKKPCGGANFPEEFWTCSDVTAGSGAAPTTAEPMTEEPTTEEPTTRAPATGGPATTVRSATSTTTLRTDEPSTPPTETATKPANGPCVDNWKSCKVDVDCCSDGYECDSYFQSSPICIPEGIQRV